MIPEIKVATNPLEYYKSFLDLPKPPANNVNQGKSLHENFKLSSMLGELLSLGKCFTITNVEREPTLNRISVSYNHSSGNYTDHAARLDNFKEIKNLSYGRPLIIEVLDDKFGNSLQMTAATTQMACLGIFVIYNGYIYRADPTANINLLYAIYSELYFLKFGGLPTEEDEYRQAIPGSRMAFFYKPNRFEELMMKYGIR